MASNQVGSTPQQEGSWLGAGIGYRARYRSHLLSAEQTKPPEVLEIIPQHFFACPSDIDALASRYRLVFHDTDLPLASLGEDRSFFEARLHRIAELVTRANPEFISSHLALTHAPSGMQVGHLAPLWFSQELLESVCRRIAMVQERLQRPLLLENLAGFVMPGAEMSEAQFLRRLVEMTGCGLLLDLSNILVNARNLGVDPIREMEDYPLAAARQVHLAGGKKDGGRWIDSHSSAVDDASFALLESVRGKCPLQAIIVERDQDFPPLAQLLGESERAAQLWRGPV